MSGVIMSIVFTTVLPAYTTAEPVTSNTATVVEHPVNKNKITIDKKNVFILYFGSGYELF
jgi:hypothetical protein